VEFGLTHGSLQPQEESVVVVAGIVQSVLVSQQTSEQRTQLQELMPVLVRTRQPTHLNAQDQADMIQPYLGQQTLEAEPVFHGRRTMPLILVDHQHALLAPA